MTGLVCFFVVFAYIYGQFKGHSWVSFLDKIFQTISNISQLKSFVERIHNTFDKFFDDLMAFIIDLAIWEDDEETLIEAKALAVVERLRQEAEELKSKHEVWKEILIEDLEEKLHEFRLNRDAAISKELSDFKTQLGAHELVIGNSVSISDLQSLWASEYPTNSTPRGQSCLSISDQQQRILAYLLDALLNRPCDSVIECADGDKFKINSLVFSLVSPVFASIVKKHKNFKLPEISGRRFGAIVRALQNPSNSAVAVEISDAVAALNVADYFAMDAVLRELITALETSDKDDQLLAALAISELNLSVVSSSSCCSWTFPLSILTSEALACLTDSTFTRLVNDRKFHRKADIEALLRFKSSRPESAEPFDFSKFLASEELEASVLPECEQLLDAEEYACLLTSVVENIEKENARISRLQSIDEKEVTLAPVQAAPVRSFRYSIN